MLMKLTRYPQQHLQITFAFSIDLEEGHQTPSREFNNFNQRLTDCKHAVVDKLHLRQILKHTQTHFYTLCFNKLKF